MEELDAPTKLHTTSQGKKFPEKTWKKVISLTIARQKQKFRPIISIKYVKAFKFP